MLKKMEELFKIALSEGASEEEKKNAKNELKMLYESSDSFKNEKIRMEIYDMRNQPASSDSVQDKIEELYNAHLSMLNINEELYNRLAFAVDYIKDYADNSRLSVLRRQEYGDEACNFIVKSMVRYMNTELEKKEIKNNKKEISLDIIQKQREEKIQPKLVVIIGSEKKKLNNHGEEAVGYISKEGKQEVLYLYDGAVKESGITFRPSPQVNMVYWQNPFDKTQYISINTIFDFITQDKMDEFDQITSMLMDAKHAVENNQPELIVRPTDLKWFRDDERVYRFIDNICNGKNIQKATMIFNSDIRNIITEDDIESIDAIYMKMPAESRIDFRNKIDEEAEKKLVFTVVF